MSMMLVAAALAFAVAVVLLTTEFVLGDGVDVRRARE